jgi:hypothetical protein
MSAIKPDESDESDESYESDESDEPDDEPIIPDEKTIEIIRRVFSPKIITIDEDEEVIIKTEAGEHCASFEIYTNGIFITALEKCGDTSGTELIQLFDKLAEEMSNITYIELNDKSQIDICGKIINLSMIKILTEGESWYNKHGYFSEENEYVKSHNESIINMPYEEFRDIVYQDELEEFKEDNTIEDYEYRLALCIKEFKRLELKKANKILDESQEEDYQRRKEKIKKYKAIIKNYDASIIKMIEEEKEKQQAEIKRGIDLFPDVNKTVKDYFNYVLSDINRNKKETGCDPITIEKCDWLNKFISNIYKSHNLIKYRAIGLKKMVIREESGKSSAEGVAKRKRSKTKKRKRSNKSKKIKSKKIKSKRSNTSKKSNKSKRRSKSKRSKKY